MQQDHSGQSISLWMATTSRQNQSVLLQDVHADECIVGASNLMHNLRAERFFEPPMVNGRMASSNGPNKTLVLRGIKDSPPYLHDGRLLTLEDGVEFFNLILETKLSEQERQHLVTFMRTL